MPDLPYDFRVAAYARSTSNGIITLLLLEHASWTLRFSDHAEESIAAGKGTTHDGEEYLHKIVSVAAPGVAGSSLPQSTIVVANLDGEYDWLDEADVEGVTAEVIEVLKSDPEVVVRHFQNFVLTEVAPDDETLTVTLGMEHLQQERFPAYGMGKVRAPALFRT